MFTGNTRVRVLFSAVLLSVVLMFAGSSAAAHTQPSSSLASQRYGVFEEPLIASSTPSLAERAALQQAIDRYRQAGDAANTLALNRFLAAYPHSVWRASLWLNIGLADRASGRYSDALHAFKQARQATSDTTLRPVGLRALSEQLALETRLGHPHQVAALLDTVQQLGPMAEDAAAVSMAKEGLWDMRHHPRTAFQCGWIALTALWHAEGLSIQSTPPMRVDPKHPGYSLQQLLEIAAHQHRPMRAIHQAKDAAIPVPSVVHWKSGHFATIVANVHGRYQVADPAMGGDAWMTAADVRAESSGYFLVPAAEISSVSYDRIVGAHEARTIRGAGYTTSNDPHGYPDCKCQQPSKHSGGVGGDGGGTGGATPGSGDTPSPGMPTYSVSPMLISLSLRDTPLGYAPPVGPAMDFTLSYNQLDVDQPTTFTYSNVGPKWTHNWLGYVEDDPAVPGSRVLVYLPSGPGRLYHGFNAASGTFAPEAETGAQLVEVSSSPVVYERRFADGSKDVFAASDNSTYYPRHVFLTERVDAHGNAMHLAYDGQSRLYTVTDAVGQVMTFHYDNAAQPLLLTRVSDAFGRSAVLSYDASGRLSGITDAIGLNSTFTYDGGTSITALTTPYGSTSFTTGQSGIRRWITITDVNGHVSRWEFNEAVSGIPYSESHVPTGINAFNKYLNSRDSFYWDAQAWATYPGDYTKAVNYHWNHVTHSGALTSVTADSLESIKYPLENRIWYNHPGDRAGGSGTLNVPSKIGRVLADGSTQLTSNTYNAQGRLTHSVDPAGLTTDYTYAPNQVDVLQIDRTAAGGYHTTESFTYDSQHNVLSHTDETGAVTQHTYNPAGQLLTTTDALGHVTTYVYDALGYRQSMTDANGHTTAYTYDAVGRLASVTDPINRTTSYTYDGLNRLVRTLYPDDTDEITTWDKLDKASFQDRNGHTTTYTYDGLRRLLTETDALGDTIASTYYPNEQLESRTDANGHTTTWQRDIEGRVIAMVDALGATTHIAYDSADRRSSVTNALGQVTTMAYDAQDRLIRTIDPNGVITDNTYTPRGWLATHTVRANASGSPSANDATTTLSYNEVGDVTGSVDPDGVTTTYTYDADHRLIATIDALGNVKQNNLDAVGNLLGQSDVPVGTTDPSWLKSYAYDAADQRIASMDADNRATTISYDVNGHANNFLDPLGILATREFDSLGLLLDDHPGQQSGHGGGHHSGQGSVGADVHYTYDAANRLTSVVDPDALTTQYTYDPVGQVIQQTSPDTGVTTYTYDPVGNRISSTDARGVETHRSYDALHRLIAVTYPSDASLDATWHYDEAPSVTGCAVSYPAGRVSRMVDASGTTTYCYDGRGNLIAQSRVISGTTYTTSYGHTLANRLAQLTYPSGSTANYGRDADGRVISIDLLAPGESTPANLISNVGYLPFGPVHEVVYANGAFALTRGYDSNYWGTDIDGLGLSLHVTRDADANIVSLQHSSSTDRLYTYNALQRLIGVNGPIDGYAVQYGYNATGDRITKTVAGTPQQQYLYANGTHHLSEMAEWRQWWAPYSQQVLNDAAGNIV